MGTVSISGWSVHTLTIVAAIAISEWLPRSYKLISLMGDKKAREFGLSVTV